MTFGYLGYVWAILGCALLAFVVLGSAVLLVVIGRRNEKSAPRAVVERVAIRSRGSRSSASESEPS